MLRSIVLAAAAASLALAGCGSSAQCSGTVTVTLASAGEDPKAVTIRSVDCVAFVNQDSVAHQLVSNPHPNHTDCPWLNGPRLATGATFTASPSGGMSTCGWHDHLDPENAAFQGTVNVQAMTGGIGGGTGGAGGGYNY